MRLLVYIDQQGVEKVELEHKTVEEREQAHRLFITLRTELEKLDSLAKAAAGVADDAAGYVE